MVEIDGRPQALEWAEVAMMTAGIMKELPGSVETADLHELGWLVEVLFHVETHLRSAIPDYGRQITPDIACAVDVCRVIREILSRGYVTAFDRETLPIEIAAIARTSRAANTLKSKPGERRPLVDRRSTLAKAVSDERQQDPTATAWEVLNRLCGGDVVKEHKDGRVWYWNKKGKLTSVGLDRFETLFSEQRPSTG